MAEFDVDREKQVVTATLDDGSILEMSPRADGGMKVFWVNPTYQGQMILIPEAANVITVAVAK